MFGIFINCDILESRALNYAALTEDGISMKKLLALLVLPLLLTACDSGDNELDCFTIDEVRESDCLADAMLNVCGRMGCSSENADLNPPLTPNCELVDCETLDCGEVHYTIDGMTVTAPGTFTDLHTDESGGLIGMINVEGVDEEADCFLIVE